MSKESAYLFKITLDLARGDLFQIVMNGSYGGQHGYANIIDPVKDNISYFALAGDGNNARVEVSGNYTLTLNLDKDTPLNDTITWVRNGDIIQTLPVAYDVFMKTQPDEGSTWIISERHSTGADGMKEGIVEFRAFFLAGKQFCFIYYEPGVKAEEVGSYFNPGMLISGAMMGTDGAYNDNFGVFENNFVCNVQGFYVMRVDFNGGEIKVDFVGYQEAMPEFEAVIKGPANDGTWNNSQRYASKNGKTEMILKLSKGEFGFTLYGDAMDPQYGDYVGFDKIGTNGNANSLFTQPENGGNNIVCTVEGTYKIVIDYSTGAPVVDFYVPDWEVIVKGSAFDVGWNGYRSVAFVWQSFRA